MRKLFPKTEGQEGALVHPLLDAAEKMLDDLATPIEISGLTFRRAAMQSIVGLSVATLISELCVHPNTTLRHPFLRSAN